MPEEKRILGQVVERKLSRIHQLDEASERHTGLIVDVYGDNESRHAPLESNRT